MVASSTRKMSYPPSLMRETTSEICSESDRDSLIASPSSFMSCLSCGSTGFPLLRQNYHDLRSSANGAHLEIFGVHRSVAILGRIVFCPKRFQFCSQRSLTGLIQSGEGDLRRSKVPAEKTYHLPGREWIGKMRILPRALDPLRAGAKPLVHNLLIAP